MNYAVLRTELLSTDPVASGYSPNYASLTDTQAAAKLNATDTGRTLPRTQVPITEFFSAIDDGGWPSTAILQDKLRGLLGMPFVDASNANTKGIVGVIFPNSGGTAATRTRLLALADQVVSRATEIGLGPVTVGDVALARAKTGGW